MHYCLVDAPRRVVINAPQSKVGFMYLSIYVERKLGSSYVNYDLTLCAGFKMSQEDFEDWWNDGTPVKVDDICAQLGLNADGLRAFINDQKDFKTEDD